MIKKVFSLLAMAAALTTVGGKVLANSFQHEEAWFYVEDTGKTNPLVNPGCSGSPMVECAQKFERFSPSSPWTAIPGDENVAYGLH